MELAGCVQLSHSRYGPTVSDRTRFLLRKLRVPPPRALVLEVRVEPVCS